MKRIFGFLFLLSALNLTAQYRIDDGSELLDLQRLPLEKMYVHPSQELLFSGEYLYYKLYCIDAQTSRLSRISTVAYVSLVDSSGKVVFEHKIRLEGGMGQGDFFVNTDLPTGSYKLLGYTQWMKNGGLSQVFQADIAIVNPYRPREVDSGDVPAAGEEAMAGVSKSEPAIEGGELLQLQLDTLSFRPRQEIQLSLRNYKGRLAHGEYSLSVVRKSDLFASHKTAETWGMEQQAALRAIPQGIGDSIYLPEQRGELFFGRVMDAAAGTPAAGKEVVLSVPGQGYILKSATTNPDGYFFTYLRKPYRESRIVCQVMGEGQYTITRGERRPMPLNTLDFKDWRPEPEHREAIVARSVNNQLENAFIGAKPDSILREDLPDPFDGGIPKVVHLDEYTRFPTLQETFVELFGNVGYRKGPGGSDYIRVAQDFETFNEPYNDDPAIVLIDGVFIRDVGAIKSFDAQRVKTIKVLQDPLVLGPGTYQGVVSIETFEGDYAESFAGGNAAVFDLAFPEPVKRYFRANHGPVSGWVNGQIPDYRYLLHWEPRITVDAPEQEIRFYSSDLEGIYEIYLEGFTTYGKPVSVQGSFTVEGAARQ